MFKIQWVLLKSKTVLTGLATVIINYLVTQDVINKHLGEVLFNLGAFLTMFFAREAIAKSGPEASKLSPPSPPGIGKGPTLSIPYGIIVLYCLVIGGAVLLNGCARFAPHTHPGNVTVCTDAPAGLSEGGFLRAMVGGDTVRVKPAVVRPTYSVFCDGKGWCEVK